MDSQLAYTLRVNGAPYAGWTAMSVTRSIERMSGEFNVRLSRNADDGVVTLSDALAPGAAAAVEIGTETLLDGFIDAVNHSFDARTSEIEIAGRDKTADLIDCAATVDGPFEFANIRLDKVVEKIIKPFGLKLTVDADVGASFKRLAIQPGETAFEFIDRACRYRAVMAVSDGIGGIVIVKPSAEKSPGRIVRGENVLRGDMSLDEAERMSLYVVKAQAEPTSADTPAGETAQSEGRAVDVEVTRYRPTVIVGENQGYDMTLKERATWERRIVSARSRRATYTVQGWEAAAGVLWKPNSLVRVIDKPSGLDREMLIVAVNFTRDAQGTITVIDLALPDAFAIAAEKEDGSGSGSNLWVDDND